jgi:hypothetical protein
MKNLPPTQTLELTEVDHRILHAIREVHFGSVEITIHNRRVVQVERREKVRLAQENEGKSHAG